MDTSNLMEQILSSDNPVSYTHLDVYKRQILDMEHISERRDLEH